VSDFSSHKKKGNSLHINLVDTFGLCAILKEMISLVDFYKK